MRKKLLYEISKPVIAAVGVENVLRAIVESIAKGTGAKGCSLLILSEDGSRLVHRISYGISGAYVGKGEIEIDATVEKVLQGEAVSIPDVADDPRVQYPEAARREGVVSVLSLPMRSSGGIMGVMRVYTAERRDFSKDEVDFLDSIAELSGLVLEKAEERERIAEEADKAREELTRVSDERERFVYLMGMVAHDLKAPLAAVQSYIKVILRGSTGPLTEKQEEWLNRSVKRIDGMLELISDIVDISRLETGHIAPELTTVSWKQVLENCIEVARGLVEPEGIVLVEEIEPDLPEIFASEVRLCQLINNLISNSVRYTPGGARIFIRAGQEEDEIVVQIEDEGSGIEPEIMPNIFDDFFKGDRESREGTGLGLSICKRIVEMHHGRIWAESPAPGKDKGTRITFTIPKGAICDLTFWEKQKEDGS
ncbi:MAG: GAF domain-containing protein [Actinobacteria bacterium]|jgi:signal transduction histidine kinase|nr:MAG: GAF domain-containing protein [Actinomycetota bacterium]